MGVSQWSRDTDEAGRLREGRMRSRTRQLVCEHGACVVPVQGAYCQAPSCCRALPCVSLVCRSCACESSAGGSDGGRLSQRPRRRPHCCAEHCGRLGGSGKGRREASDRSEEGEKGQATEQWWQIRASGLEVEVEEWPSLIGNPLGRKAQRPKNSG